MESDMDPNITADEIALYDRQIRLWGVQGQTQLRSASILLITAKAIANEVAKNLVLAGIGSLTIIDHEPVTQHDIDSSFFLAAAFTEDESIVVKGKNRAEVAAPPIRRMNPRVKLSIDTSDVRLKDPTFFAQFDMIIATDLEFTANTTINAACRVANRPFYAAGLHGMYGFVFADLISHDFVIERQKSNFSPSPQETQTRSIVSITRKKQGKNTIELVTKRETYSPLILANTSPLPKEFTSVARRRKQVTPLISCLRALWEFEKTSEGHKPPSSAEDIARFTELAVKSHRELNLEMENLSSVFIRKFLQNLGLEVSPVAAFLGGYLAQDAINVITNREQPLQNMLLFDGETSIGPIYPLHPFFPSPGVMTIPIHTSAASAAIETAANSIVPAAVAASAQESITLD
ncbi:Ubiquitin/SUMO-activating enzyme E1 [Penicillium taxi]|uniref:Ubiquitin/SUMO-activating enzyme E1 n=1 Tax=Penicillium taxi TaxID=168475 RepID=UPI002545ABEB|nr:Ubiquitin/SUMO-activating enzyme E1 [Penicillium taxi]KAJ5888949.1 Ubiquitin/SUMO-activating enzyme E1 [Penicillium taxi]